MEVDENGDVREKEKDVKEEINRRVVTDKEREEHISRLYAKDPILKLKTLRLGFQQRKSLRKG